MDHCPHHRDLSTSLICTFVSVYRGHSPFSELSDKTFVFLVSNMTGPNEERLALSFEEEFWSLKHQNSPSEAVEESKLRDKEVSFTENMLAAACVGFGREIREEVDGPSMWIGRAVSIGVDKHNLL